MLSTKFYMHHLRQADQPLASEALSLLFSVSEFVLCFVLSSIVNFHSRLSYLPLKMIIKSHDNKACKIYVLPSKAKATIADRAYAV